MIWRLSRSSPVGVAEPAHAESILQAQLVNRNFL
jgi:hypothetical protein